jgi:hypothetical protein
MGPELEALEAERALKKDCLCLPQTEMYQAGDSFENDRRICRASMKPMTYLPDATEKALSEEPPERFPLRGITPV